MDFLPGCFGFVGISAILSISFFGLFSVFWDFLNFCSFERFFKALLKLRVYLELVILLLIWALWGGGFSQDFCISGIFWNFCSFEQFFQRPTKNQGFNWIWSSFCFLDLLGRVLPGLLDFCSSEFFLFTEIFRELFGISAASKPSSFFDKIIVNNGSFWFDSLQIFSEQKGNTASCPLPCDRKLLRYSNYLFWN